MSLKLVIGNHHADSRGLLTFNNDFDASDVKRIYFIENCDTSFIRAWQGHREERRWFTVVCGSFEIKLILIDDWKNPSPNLQQEVFVLTSENLVILPIPKGYVSSIKALEDKSKLMVMADYLKGEIHDEYRFLLDYFQETN